MYDKIIKVLEDYDKKTGGHCGITTASLIQQTQIDAKEIKLLLNQLVRQKKITFHPNVQGLIFKLKK
jgi:hypothetical protein